MTATRISTAAARGLLAAAALTLGALAPPAALADHTHEASRVAQLAMSTASMWMIEHHQHAIERSLAAGDLPAAKHEAQELVPWMRGTAWVPELDTAAHNATAAVQAVVFALDGADQAEAKAAVEEMGKRFHHLHHELMEAVAGGHGGGHEHDSGHEHGKKTH